MAGVYDKHMMGRFIWGLLQEITPMERVNLTEVIKKKSKACHKDYDAMMRNMHATSTSHKRNGKIEVRTMPHTP